MYVRRCLLLFQKTGPVIEIECEYCSEESHHPGAIQPPSIQNTHHHSRSLRLPHRARMLVFVFVGDSLARFAWAIHRRHSLLSLRSSTTPRLDVPPFTLRRLALWDILHLCRLSGFQCGTVDQRRGCGRCENGGRSGGCGSVRKLTEVGIRCTGPPRRGCIRSPYRSCPSGAGLSTSRSG